ncbi:hypothetical protein BJX96DRAFT_139905 [Aspergillus floccosus]
MIRVIIFLRATASSNADPMYGMGTTEGSVADEISLHLAKDGLTVDPMRFRVPNYYCMQTGWQPKCAPRTELHVTDMVPRPAVSVGMERDDHWKVGLYGVSRWQVTHVFLWRYSGVDLVGV